MGLFEEHRINANKRAAWSVAVMEWAAVQRPRLRPGVLFLGAEIGKRPRDSVWWLTEPTDAHPEGRQVKLGEDWGRFKNNVQGVIGRNPNRELRRRAWAGFTRVASLVAAGALAATGLGAPVAAAVAAAGEAAARGVAGAGGGGELGGVTAEFSNALIERGLAEIEGRDDEQVVIMAPGGGEVAVQEDDEDLAWEDKHLWHALYSANKGTHPRPLLMSVLATLPEWQHQLVLPVAGEAWNEGGYARYLEQGAGGHPDDGVAPLTDAEREETLGVEPPRTSVTITPGG